MDFNDFAIDVLIAATEYSLDEVLAPRLEQARRICDVKLFLDTRRKLQDGEAVLEDMLTHQYF